MIGVRINFSGAQPAFDWSQTAVDFDSTVQNAMVNLGTQLGSDSLFPDKGTYILQDAAQGRMINLQWANNMSNFAAMRTLVFSKNTDVPGDKFGMQALTLQAAVFNVNRLQLAIFATCVDGTTRGTQVTL